MTTADDLVRPLPIRDIDVCAGSYGNCGGVVFAGVDLEPGTTDGFEVSGAEADLPDWVEDHPEDGRLCMAKERLRHLFGTESAVRLLVRGPIGDRGRMAVRVSPVDRLRPGAGPSMVVAAPGRGRFPNRRKPIPGRSCQAGCSATNSRISWVKSSGRCRFHRWSASGMTRFVACGIWVASTSMDGRFMRSRSP